MAAGPAGCDQEPGSGTFRRSKERGMNRRRHLEAEEILERGNEVGIVRVFGGSDAMGLQLMSLPDPLHRAQRHTHHFGLSTANPMGGSLQVSAISR